MDFTIAFVDGLQDVSPSEWDALAGDAPMLSHAFLSTLESSQSVGMGTGWQPFHLLVRQNHQLVGAMPLYIKSHSYGEYVFDWAWANAYENNGLNYYPKLVSAIPFTPITSARLLAKDLAIQRLMLDAMTKVLYQHQLSSAHVLFPDEDSASPMQAAGWLKRSGVQFRWNNHGFANFEAFLAALSHDKRKRIRQERKKIVQAGVVCRHIKGAEISESDWDFFYQCYCNTYAEHRSTPYLTRQFFSQIGKKMPQHIVLMVAEKDGVQIASALNFYSQSTLYGRYWGAMQFVSGLHFELCYYQAQQFCMTENIQYFEGGAQGEHKLARGFEPRHTLSYHYIVEPAFKAAIVDFLCTEAAGVAVYASELEERAPFKHLS